MSEQIILKFSPISGETMVEAKGFKGKSCKDATKFLKSLGNERDFQRKESWYEHNLPRQTINSNLCG